MPRSPRCAGRRRSDMTDPTILLAVADGVATVTLNRPDQRNALNLAMCDDLHRVMTQINGDPAVRVVVFKANGPVFGAGADLKERQGKSPEWVRERRRRAFAAYTLLA